MKNPTKLLKIFGFLVVLVTVVSVTFFVSGLMVLAQNDNNWQEPDQPPPLGNRPGFIYNNKDSVQRADINIDGQAKVGSFAVSGDSSLKNTVVSKLCFSSDPNNCLVDWDNVGGGFWEEAGNNIFNSNVGNVGINNNSPQAKLDVKSPSATIAIFGGSTATNQAVRVSNSTGFVNIGIGVTTKHPYLWSSTGNLFVGSDGNPTLFIQGMNNGNVGIGTASPNQKLEINGNVAVNGDLRFKRNAAIAGLNMISTYPANNDKDLAIYAQQNLYLLMNEQPYPAAGDLIISRDSAEYAETNSYLVVKNDGNVGIGVRNPANKLEIKGNVLVDGGLNDTVSVGIGSEAVPGATNALQVYHNFQGTSGSAYGLNSNRYQTTNNNTTGSVFGVLGQGGKYNANLSKGIGVAGLAGGWGTGTLTNGYSFYAYNPGGTVTNKYGLYLEPVTGGSSSNYSIYSAGGTSYFAGNIGVGTASIDTRNKVTIIGQNSGIEASVNSGSYSGNWGNDPNDWNRAGHFKLTGTSYPAEAYIATSPYRYNVSYGVWASGTTAGLYGTSFASGVVGESYFGGTGVTGRSSCDSASGVPGNDCNNSIAVAAYGTGYSDGLVAEITIPYIVGDDLSVPGSFEDTVSGEIFQPAFQPNESTAQTAAVRAKNNWSNGWGVYSDGAKNLFGGITLNKSGSAITANTDCAAAGAGTMMYSLNSTTNVGHFYGCVQTAANTYRWKQLDN